MSSIPPPASPTTPATAPAAPGPASWGALRVLAGLGIFLVALILEAGVVSAFDSDLDSLAAKLSLQALLAATLIVVAFAAAKNNGFAPADALGLRRPLISPVRPAITAYLIYIAFAIVIAALIQPEQEDLTRELGFHESAFGAVAAAVLIVIAAPLSEEIFFRGFMFAGIRRSAPFWIAAAGSAVVWGLFHYTGPGSWGVCLQLAIFGVILAWLYERTGSIWPTIAVHMFNNALAFAILAS
jgi:membrane protease YdiL (CAAX protease family)